MANAKSVVAGAYGGPEVLEVVERPLAEPGPGEVVLGVRAAGVNPIDWKRYSGARGTDPAALPMRLGLEAAGVIEAVGAEAVGPAGPVAVGDEVMAYSITGGYADRVVIPASSVVPKPAELDWAPAGGLLLAGVTAAHALAAVEVSRGEVLLLHAASGAVGRLATEIAVGRGVRVIGTAGAAQHDALRALGAEPVDYGPGLEGRIRALAPDGVDAAIDAAGGDESLDACLAFVADRDRIASIVVGPRERDAGIRMLGGAPGADAGREVRAAARLELAELAARGGLRLPTRAFALDAAADAHRLSRDGHPGAKLVLVP